MLHRPCRPDQAPSDLGPGAGPVRPDGRVDDAHHLVAGPEVGEVRLKGLSGPLGGHRLIIIPEQVEHGVVVAHGMPRGQGRVFAGVPGLLLRRFVEDLVGLLAVADPEGVGMDVAPGVGLLGAEDLDLDVDLAAGRGLAGREIPAGPVPELEEERGVVVQRDGHLFRLAGGTGPERQDAALGPAPLGQAGMELGHDLDDLLSGDELDQVEPVAAEVGDDVGVPGDLGVQPPGIVRLEKEPVLEEVADEGPDISQVAAPGPGRRFLHDGIVAIAEVDRRQSAVLRGQRQEFGRFARVEGQRLFGQEILSGPDGLGVDVEVDVVRGAVVHDLDLGIGDEGVGVAVDPPDAEPVGRGAGQLRVRIGHGRDLDPAEAPQHVQVDHADVARPDEPDLDRLHGYLRFPLRINQGTPRGKGPLFCACQIPGNWINRGLWPIWQRGRDTGSWSNG